VLHGTWLGHPLHPVLTDVPLGAWTTAFALDCFGSRAGGGAKFADAAQLALGVGIVGGVGAVLTGLTDWQYTHDDARRTGLVHGILNLFGLGLSAWSWSRGHRERDGWSRLASGLGYGTALFSGFLGGNLVFRERIGVDRTERPMEPREFVPVMFEDELADERVRHVRAGDADVILVRSGGRVYGVWRALSASRRTLVGWLAFRWKHRLPMARSALRSMHGLNTQGPGDGSADPFRNLRPRR